MKSIFLFLIIIIFVSLTDQIYGQAEKTKIRGTVTDAKTKEPVPFVNVSFKGTNIGCITDFDGGYYIETRLPGDSILASYIGYKPKSHSVKMSQFQTINFELKPENFALDDVKVVAERWPANAIIKNMIANKKINSPRRIDTYECEIYNKMEIDVNNIDDEFKKSRVFNQFQFIFEYVDTSAITGKSYLPVSISETLSDYYFRRKPFREKEIIKANHISGVENESVSQYTGQMYIEIDMYDNYLPMFGKSFISPIADFALLTYRYYLVDSAYIQDDWCYHISFKPRRKQELTFSGDFWVTDSTYAVRKVKARIADDANINYVNDMMVSVEYMQVNDSLWFKEKEELFIDFNVTDKSTGLFGRKTTSFKNVIANKPRPDDFFSANAPQESITLKGATKMDTSYWNSARHEGLSLKEEKIYSMVDSIKQVPVFNTFVDIVTLVVSGYYKHGKFEYGPYFKVFSINPIEGYRFRLGGRTSNDFSKKVMYEGHLAYGTKDKNFKYGIGMLYMLNKNPRSSFGFSYKYDIEQLGLSSNAFTESNIMASILARNERDKLLMVEEFKGFYEKEWFLGFSNKLRFAHRQIFPSDNILFKQDASEVQFSKLTSFEVTLNTRLAYNEKIVEGEFNRVSFGSKYPIINIDLTAGLKNVFYSDYEYYKAEITFDHHFDINPLGRLNYKIHGGKIWGKLPYPLLKLHEGNETYAFDEYSFNMMNYYEFVSDIYTSVYLEHHFQGFFFNKIPLLRRLKFREVAYVKGLMGWMSDKTYEIMDFPETLHGLDKPYFEGGVGIENILKLFRIDAIWRFSYLDNPNIQIFGVRAKLQIIF